MKDDEKSLLPQMSTPVARKPFEAPAMGEIGAAVQPSNIPAWFRSADCAARTRCAQQCRDGACWDRCWTQS